MLGGADAADTIERSGHLVSDHRGTRQYGIDDSVPDQFGDQRRDAFVDVGAATSHRDDCDAALLRGGDPFGGRIVNDRDWFLEVGFPFGEPASVGRIRFLNLWPSFVHTFQILRRVDRNALRPAARLDDENRMPFSSARNCSRLSISSSGETGRARQAEQASARIGIEADMLEHMKSEVRLRGYGINEREKYSAIPPRSVTTLTTPGSANSAFVKNFLLERHDFDRSRPRNGATTSSIISGSIIGSSPWIFTTTSAASDAIASATRSVPERCSAEVITARPPKRSTAR